MKKLFVEFSAVAITRKKLLIASLSIFLVGCADSLLSGQIEVDSIKIPPRLNARPQWERDQFQIETAISAAAKTTKEKNKNVTVYLSSGTLKRTPQRNPKNNNSDYSADFQHREYRLGRTLMIPGGVVLAGKGIGRREVRMVWEKCEPNSSLLVFRNGYGGGLRNLDIRTADGLKNVTNVTAIYLQSQSSAVFEDFDIDLTTLGPDSNGIVIDRDKTNTESVKFDDFNIRASRPVIIMTGDNLVFSNFDCTCASPVTKNSISAVFQNWNGALPANWTIGPGSGQLGDHAISLTGKRDKTGDALTIIGFRYEQGSDKGPAWLFDIERLDKNGNRAHAFESLIMLNCRSSPKPKGSNYVSVKIPENSIIRVDIIGGYLPGKTDAPDIKKTERKTNFRKQ